MSETLVVVDRGRPLAFSFADLMRFHGPGSPGGVAHAFKVLQRALPLLESAGPPERRAIAVRTAFGGPGARDGFECVLRAVTEARYVVDAGLERADLPPTRRRFVFCLSHRDRSVISTLRAGFVTQPFLDLVALRERTGAEEERLTRMKQELADRLMAAPAADVYDAIVAG